MSKPRRPDLCVIGAGAGGLAVAAGAAQMGAQVVLIEKGDMGGDCLNTGCVPSKALLAAAHAAESARRAGRFGVDVAVRIDGRRVFDHVRGVIAAIAPHDSQPRFEQLGCTVIRAPARFVAADTVEAGGQRIQARRFVIATGSQPVMPPIEGLAALRPLTNETIFNLTDIPGHLLVIGGGPIGCELAQAFARLGAQVTVLEMFSILPKDDPALVDVVRQALGREGVNVRERVKVVRAQGTADAPAVVLETADGKTETLTGTHLLVAAGRRASVEGLGLDAAGITYSPRGIEVDSRLKTQNRHVYAIGDVTGAMPFTHVAGYHAGIVIRNALLRLPARANHASVPWVTYTEPELAAVGIGEQQARQSFGASIRVLQAGFDENDRAITARTTEGMIKVVTRASGRIVGCAIVGPQAGELIQPWVLALEKRLKISTLASTIAPYPTLGEISKRAAGSFYTPTLYGRKTRWLVRVLSLFG